MASRSDQLHSHQFVLQRVVGALAMRDPDPAGSPLRRTGGALAAGLMVAVLGLAAVGVYGVLRPGGGGSWRDGGSVIVERETGARFVFADGRLHPVLNYASALLILGAAGPAGTVSVSRSALAGVPRGVPLGIAGAPELLPTRADLVGDGWTVCSRTGAAESVLFVGPPPPVPASRLDDTGLLATDPDGGLALLWHNRRFAIEDADLVLAAFAWQRRSVVPVATAVLNAVPPGPSLGRVPVDRSGRSSSVDGLLVGQVFVVENASGGRQYGVAQPAGLAELTPAQADLLIADGANGLGGRPIALSPAQYAAAPRATSLVPAGESAPPASAPRLAAVGAEGGVCAAVSGSGSTEVTVSALAPRAAGELRTTAASSTASTVDWMAVPPGRGAVVESLAGPAAPAGALSLVTDLGLRFSLASPDVLGMLGYAGVVPVRLPASVVALVPAGLPLDPASARRAA